jgi:hypothetical protein
MYIEGKHPICPHVTKQITVRRLWLGVIEETQMVMRTL